MKTRNLKKALSGGAKMKKAGKRPILLGVTEMQKQILQLAADQESRPLTQYVLFHALEHARANHIAR